MTLHVTKQSFPLLVQKCHYNLVFSMFPDTPQSSLKRQKVSRECMLSPIACCLYLQSTERNRETALFPWDAPLGAIGHYFSSSFSQQMYYASAFPQHSESRGFSHKAVSPWPQEFGDIYLSFYLWFQRKGRHSGLICLHFLHKSRQAG